MIEEIDRALEQWLGADIGLASGESEVTFDQPEQGWDARRSTPMINLFLYSINKSASHQRTGIRVVKTEDGSLARQLEVPIVEARYLVSVWGGGPRLEHELLGRLVNLLASTPSIPTQHMGPTLQRLSPQPVVVVSPDSETSLTHLWSGLGVPPRAAVQLLVYSPLGHPISVPVPDPPSSVQIGVDRTTPSAAFSPRRRTFGTIGSSLEHRRPTVVLEDSGRDQGAPGG